MTTLIQVLIYLQQLAVAVHCILGSLASSLHFEVTVTSSVEHQYVMCTLVCIRENTLQQTSVQQHSIE